MRPGAPPSPLPSPPLLSLGGAALCLGAAVLLLWPMALVTAPLVYFDSFAYAGAGERAIGALRGALWPQAAGGGDGGGGGAAAGEGLGVLRSAAWSVWLAGLGGLPWGAVAACALQTAATLFVLGALVPAGAAIRPKAALAGAAAVGLLSGLPWYASYAMPDILGALVVAYYAALAGPLDRAGRALRLLLGALAAFAILAHYGHLPLAAALAALVLLLRVRRWNAALLLSALLPVGAAVLVNLATGLAAERLAPPRAAGEATAEASPPAEASLAPRRLPVLLARSIDDGLALPHLRAACARDLYESCAFLGEVPGTAGGFLWGEEGIRRLDAAQMAVLRSEELAIVLGAARERPLRQAGALLANGALQMVRVGTDEILPLPPPGPDGSRPRPVAADASAYPVLGRADIWVPALTLAAALALVFRAGTGRLHPALGGPLLVVLAGLAVNAAVYGGLSYPVDRYGGRLAWLGPALLALDLALRRPALNGDHPAAT